MRYYIKDIAATNFRADGHDRLVYRDITKHERDWPFGTRDLKQAVYFLSRESAQKFVDKAAPLFKYAVVAEYEIL